MFEDYGSLSRTKVTSLFSTQCVYQPRPFREGNLRLSYLKFPLTNVRAARYSLSEEQKPRGKQISL